MKGKTARAGQADRADFKEFSGLLTRLIDATKSDSLGVAEAAAITGLKLSKDAENTNDYTLFYRSERYDSLWAYGLAGKGAAPPRPPSPSGNKFLEAIQLRLPNQLSTHRGSMVDLNLKEGTRFTVADFDALFKRAAIPSFFPHPTPTTQNTNQYIYEFINMKIGLTCAKDTGYCRTVVVDKLKANSSVPATPKK